MCDARKSDRFGTVHQCVIEEPHHGGYHETADGFMFAVNEGDQLRMRRVPWRAEQYLGATGAIRELVPVLGRSGHHPEAGVEVECIGLDGEKRIRQVFRGEWVVMFDDGTSEVFNRDRFEVEFRRAER